MDAHGQQQRVGSGGQDHHNNNGTVGAVRAAYTGSVSSGDRMVLQHGGSTYQILDTGSVHISYEGDEDAAVLAGSGNVLMLPCSGGDDDNTSTSGSSKQGFPSRRVSFHNDSYLAAPGDDDTPGVDGTAGGRWSKQHSPIPAAPIHGVPHPPAQALPRSLRTSVGSISELNLQILSETKPHRCGMLSMVYALVIMLTLGVTLPAIELFSHKVGPYTFLHSRTVACVMGSVALVYLLVVDHVGRRSLDANSATTRPSTTSRASHFTRVYSHPATRPTLYFRLATALFGLGGVTIAVLEIWNSGFMATEECNGREFIVYDVAYLVFLLAQIYSMLTHFKVQKDGRISCYARWCLAHLVATNLSCIGWSVFDQNLAENTHEHHRTHTRQQDPAHCVPTLYSDYLETNELCVYDTEAGKAWLSSAPYLYPCIIQFHIICSMVMLVRWRHLRVARHDAHKLLRTQSTASLTSTTSRRSSSPTPAHTSRVARVFAHTTSGLVFSAVVTVAAVTTIVLMNVWFDDPARRETTYLSATLVDLFLYLVSLALVCAGFVSIHRDLHRQPSAHGVETTVDTVLVWSSACGPTLYHSFCALADVYIRGTAGGELSWLADIITNLVAALQTCVQTLFILDAMRRRRLVGDEAALSRRFMSAKQVMAFLTFFNLSLMLVMAFRHQRPDFSPIQKQFFGMSTWITISRMCLPVTIFYRFTCTIICLNLWRNVYSKKIKGH